MGVICLITNCCLNSEIIKSFQIDNEYSEAMSNILNYKEFQQKVKSKWINDETILINMVIQCLTNCCRSDNNEMIRTVLREKKIISNCLILTQICHDDNLGMRTSLLLAELLNDSDLNATSTDVINDLINDYFTYLIRAFNSTTQSYHHTDILLLLKGLLLLCKNDIIQDLISKTDNIKILIEMSIQYPIMYDILWTLSFHSNIQIQLKNDKAFVNTIKRLKDDKAVSAKHIITENISNEHITPIISSPNIQKQYQNKEVKKWTNTDIVHWCEDYNLITFSKILSNFDGNSLIQLHLLCKTNSNQVIDLLQNDSKKLGYDLSILELARFQSQLEKIIFEKDENRKKTTLSIKSPTISTSNRVSKTCLIL
ncbi:unnamed protein product [Didymodactylos carnosus]|uniref:Uncharacterized protein n=1 Tax=Didymodactylos carnosus TaxID=1234261 RepID=A0A815I1N3_9BILA|nr:unnamed protein product [Didymodactylos carnosus]CAF4237687.1 unnamed protein product [Didymodactylos carnosus]